MMTRGQKQLTVSVLLFSLFLIALLLLVNSCEAEASAPKPRKLKGRHVNRPTCAGSYTVWEE